MSTHQLIDDHQRAWDRRFAHTAKNINASEIRDLFALLDNPDIISFAGGFPDASLFAVPQIRQSYQDALAEHAGASLQYCASEGYLPLRRWIVEHMGRQGVSCTPDNILITSGAQQAIEFLSRLFLNPGDAMAVTKPSYLGALQIFNAYGPDYRFIDDPDVNQGRRLKMLYANPDFSNPTGRTMDQASRLRLLSLARSHDAPLIEDGAYSSLRYDGEAEPSLLHLDIAEHGSIDRALVVYCGSFSKTMTPGMRLGWICAARPLISKLTLMKQSSDLNSSTINQMVMHRVASEVFDTSVTAARRVYRERRDNMIQALHAFMPDSVTWETPQGGMFVWLTLPKTVDAKHVLVKAIAQERVAFVPGRPFHADGTGGNTLRLCFSSCAPDLATEGVSRLARLIAAETATREVLAV